MNLFLPFKYLIPLILISCDSNTTEKNITDIGEVISEVEPRFLSNKFSTGENYLNIESKDLNIGEDLTTINMVVSWDGSWRQGDQYDAAWLIVKIKDDSGNWHHGNIISNTVEIRNTELEVAAEFKVTRDGVGMMIFRSEDGEGNNNWNVSLSVENLGNGSITDAKVFGLEMIHVVKGPFELGTLKSERDRREVLTPGAGGAPYDPFFTFKSGVRNNFGGIFKVTSEAAIEIGKEDGNLYWIDANIPGTNTFSGVPEGTLSEAFPKGTKGFYQMKYELSQGEYCNFLNTLTKSQQQSRDFTKTIEFKRPISDYRNMIRYENGMYITNRPDRPCNYISWLDGQAYADWAGLRHMTEMEFEKACRGPEKAVYREYVWGVNEIRNRVNMEYSSGFFDENGTTVTSEDGNEFTDGNNHSSMFSYYNMIDVCSPEGRFYDPECAGCRTFVGGDGGRGPVRKGIFGRNSNGNRIKAGATYYGAMEMGGNLQEPVVTVGHPSGRKFKGTHGDGKLSNDGFATNEDWQPINGEYAFGGRGGCWKFHENHARTSDRFKGLRTKENRRASHIGFRGVRTDF